MLFNPRIAEALAMASSHTPRTFGQGTCCDGIIGATSLHARAKRVPVGQTAREAALLPLN